MQISSIGKTLEIEDSERSVELDTREGDLFDLSNIIRKKAQICSNRLEFASCIWSFSTSGLTEGILSIDKASMVETCKVK